MTTTFEREHKIVPKNVNDEELNEVRARIAERRRKAAELPLKDREVLMQEELDICCECLDHIEFKGYSKSQIDREYEVQAFRLARKYALPINKISHQYSP